MRFTLASALVLALFLVACGGSSRSAPPPAEPTPAPTPAPDPEPDGAASAACVEGNEKLAPMTRDEAESRGLAMMEEMGTLFESNATDCKALASGIRAWVKTNCTLLLRMKAFAETQTQADKDEFDRKHGDKMMAIGMKMVPAMNHCAEDPDLAAAMDEIPADR